MLGNLEPQITLQAAGGFLTNLVVGNTGAHLTEIAAAVSGTADALFFPLQVAKALYFSNKGIGDFHRSQHFADVSVTAQSPVNLTGSSTSGCHGLNDGMGSVHGVAAGINTFHTGFQAARLYGNGIAPAQF